MSTPPNQSGKYIPRYFLSVGWKGLIWEWGKCMEFLEIDLTIPEKWTNNTRLTRSNPVELYSNPLILHSVNETKENLNELPSLEDFWWQTLHTKYLSKQNKSELQDLAAVGALAYEDRS